MHNLPFQAPRSPTDSRELERVLGTAWLAHLVGVSVSSVRRYAAGTRSTPPDVAERVHCLGRVVADLIGSYDDSGVRRWFERPRTELNGLAPSALLQGAWDPQDDGPAQVRRLASTLAASPES